MLRTNRISGPGASGRTVLLLGTVLAAALLTSLPASASDASSLNWELNLIGGYDGDRDWTTATSGAAMGAPRNSAGLEYYSRLADEGGDFLTVDVQLRVSHDPNADDGEIGIELHNAWAEYKLGLGRNLVVGHFSPAYGLESVTDTHATLLQTLVAWDLGFKKDWGVGYRGILGPYDLSAAGQLGSGMGIGIDDGSFLASAQLWEPPGDEFRYGLSLLAGRVLPASGAWALPSPEFADVAVTKLRAGAAFELTSGSFEWMGEAAAGTNDGDAVAGALLQVGYVPPRVQELTLEAQGRVWSADLENSNARRSAVLACASYRLTRSWTLRAGAHAELERPGADGDAGITLQAYYFGG